jgi:hypothetical protein
MQELKLLKVSKALVTITKPCRALLYKIIRVLPFSRVPISRISKGKTSHQHSFSRIPGLQYLLGSISKLILTSSNQITTFSQLNNNFSSRDNSNRSSRPRIPLRLQQRPRIHFQLLKIALNRLSSRPFNHNNNSNSKHHTNNRFSKSQSRIPSPLQPIPLFHTLAQLKQGYSKCPYRSIIEMMGQRRKSMNQSKTRFMARGRV